MQQPLPSKQDPFYVVRDQVKESLVSIREIFQQWKRLIFTTNTATNEEFDLLHNQLQNSLRSVYLDLQELQKTVHVVERNPVKFHLSELEIDSRKRFVSDTMKELETIKSTLQSPRTLQKLEEDRKKSSSGGSLLVKKNLVYEDERKSRAARNMERLNDQYIQDEALRQENLIEQQDSSLDELASAVIRIGNMGKEIHEELNEHNRMLEEVGGRFDSTQGRLQLLQGRISRLVRETGRGQFCLIIGLFFLFIILTMLVIGL
ncbi:Syntaxin-6 [Galdieria sulphuraria]|uniref:Syntaxin 6 n=1 Tax=Galdieria sulphuraria TaxID=130081 RepID=M2WY41_GALSU|nr:syntaxin 6 [Galdieria sulphuraria]EME28985.1 syntaxin 6 [Galdieria sulphuraria]GJD06924.1 Syntaxin-6 [Galdieria sulphuraria]|eukprot:XP_005705505.1 syntaxin 6 [Galdieria sulphuraria]